MLLLEKRKLLVQLSQLEQKWLRIKNKDGISLVFRDECNPSTDNPILIEIEKEIKEIESKLGL